MIIDKNIHKKIIILQLAYLRLPNDRKVFDDIKNKLTLEDNSLVGDKAVWDFYIYGISLLDALNDINNIRIKYPDKRHLVIRNKIKLPDLICFDVIKYDAYFEGKIQKVIIEDVPIISNILILSDRYIVYSVDNILKVWDIIEYKYTQIINDHTGYILSLILLKDLKYCSSSLDLTLRIWNLSTRECEHILKGHREPVFYMVTIDDKIISCAHIAEINVWNYNTGQLENTLCDPINIPSNISSVFVTKNRLITSSHNGLVYIWNILTNTCERILPNINNLHYLNDTHIITSSDNHITMWNISTLEKENIFESENITKYIYFLPNNTFISITNRTVEVWDIKTQSVIHRLLNIYSPRIHFLTEDYKLVIGMNNEDIISWDPGETEKILFTVPLSRTRIMEKFKNGKILSVFENKILIWE